MSKFDLEKRAVELFSEWSNTGWSKGQAIQLAREAVAAARAEFDHGLAALLQFNLEAAKRKAADERAEEIARLLMDESSSDPKGERAFYRAAQIARSTITPPPVSPPPAPKSPETREQRLEKALREIANSDSMATWLVNIAREALEGKP